MRQQGICELEGGNVGFSDSVGQSTELGVDSMRIPILEGLKRARLESLNAQNPKSKHSNYSLKAESGNTF